MGLFNWVKELSDEKQLQLIADGNHEKIMKYIKKFPLCVPAQEDLLSRGNHEEIMAFITERMFSPEIEEQFIKQGNHDEIMSYVQHKHSLTCSGEQALIQRENDEELIAYIKEHSLYHPCIITLIEKGKEDVLMLCMNNPFPEEIQKLMLEKCSLNVLQEYIQKHRLWPSVLEEFFKQGSMELWEEYVSLHGLTEADEMIMLNSCSKEYLLAYIKEDRDFENEAAENQLFQQGDEDILKLYLERNQIYSSTECVLIQRGCHDLIMQYVRNCEETLSSKAWEELLKRNNSEELDAYLANHALDEECEIVFIQKASPERIIAYLDDHELHSESMQALLKRINLPKVLAQGFLL